MKFSELLNQYIHLLGVTGQELAERSGISASVISRYRSGEREPQPDSEAVEILARTFAAISERRNSVRRRNPVSLSGCTAFEIPHLRYLSAQI